MFSRLSKQTIYKLMDGMLGFFIATLNVHMGRAGLGQSKLPCRAEPPPFSCLFFFFFLSLFICLLDRLFSSRQHWLTSQGRGSTIAHKDNSLGVPGDLIGVRETTGLFVSVIPISSHCVHEISCCFAGGLHTCSRLTRCGRRKHIFFIIEWLHKLTHYPYSRQLMS